MQSIISVGIAGLYQQCSLQGRVHFSLPSSLGLCFSNLNSILSLIILINLFLFNVFRCWVALLLFFLWLVSILSGRSSLLSSFFFLLSLWSGNLLSRCSWFVIVSRGGHRLCMSLHILSSFIDFLVCLWRGSYAVHRLLPFSLVVCHVWLCALHARLVTLIIIALVFGLRCLEFL